MANIPATDVAIFSAAVSVCSLALAARLAWLTKFSPPRLVGIPSCLVLYSFSTGAGASVDRFLAPMVWLTNMGARPMLVQDLRLTLQPDGGSGIELHPVHSIPSEAINSVNTFEEHEQVRLGLSPFGGFAVLPGERWSNNYAFDLSAEQFARLRGTGVVTLEIRQIGAHAFKQVASRRFDFTTHEFSWLQWAEAAGPTVDYFYPTEH